MAPEGWNKGAIIDQVTNVFTLGRTAAEFLGRGATSVDAWMGTDRMRLVTLKATSKNRSARHQSVRVCRGLEIRRLSGASLSDNK